MTVNKVEYAGKVLLDLTEDTVSPDKLISGATAHDKTGAKIVGTLEDVGSGKYIWKKHLGKVWTLQEHISEQQHRLIIRVLYMVTILQQMMDISAERKRRCIR